MCRDEEVAASGGKLEGTENLFGEQEIELEQLKEWSWIFS